MPTGTTIRLCSKGAQAVVVWLEVGYDGLEPPTALFDDLAMVGWRPPTPEPPPKHAIDWSTPDPTTGARFTLRPWRVEGARVEPPAGSGPRRQWTPDEQRAFLQTLDGVLARHAVARTGDDERPPTAASTTTSPPAPPTRARTTAAAPPPPTTPAPPPPAPAAALPPPPAAPPPPTPAPDPDPFGHLAADRFHRVVAVLPRGAARVAVAAALDALGLVPEWTHVHRTVTSRYRGSVSEEVVAVPAVAVLCPGARVAAVATTLVDEGVVAGAAGLDVEPVTGEELAQALERAADEAATVAQLARLSLVVEPHLAVEVATALEAAGAVGVARTRTRRMVEQRFRGSTTEVAVPAVLVSARCVPADAPGLALVAATAADSRVDAVDVELPSKPGPETAGRAEPEPAGPSSRKTEHPLIG